MEDRQKRIIAVAGVGIIVLIIAGAIFLAPRSSKQQIVPPPTPTSSGATAYESGEDIYYASLLTKCDSAKNSVCCRASVDSMKTGSYKEMPASGCGAGLIQESLKCSDTLVWCIPRGAGRVPTK